MPGFSLLGSVKKKMVRINIKIYDVKHPINTKCVISASVKFAPT